MFFVKFLYLNSQAPDWKSNPHVPDLPRTAVSVKTLSKSFENINNIVAGAKHDKLILRFEIYLEIAINYLLMVPQRLWSEHTSSTRNSWMTVVISSIPFFITYLVLLLNLKSNHYFICLKMTRRHSKINCDSLTKISIFNSKSSKSHDVYIFTYFQKKENQISRGVFFYRFGITFETRLWETENLPNCRAWQIRRQGVTPP